MRTRIVHKQKMLVRIITRDRSKSGHMIFHVCRDRAIDKPEVPSVGDIEKALRRLADEHLVRLPKTEIRKIAAQLCQKAELSHNQINSTFLTGDYLYQMRVDASVAVTMPVGDNDNTPKQIKAHL